MDENYSVSIKNLTVKYGDFKAVDNVSFDLGKGAFGLLGRNGAGKTTILRTLLGLIKPEKGEISIFGRDPLKEGPNVRALIGYMPEGNTFFPDMTGFEAVAYSGELSGLSRNIAKRRAHEVLYFAGLGEARYRKVSGFSQGMLQRIKFAMALVHDPPLLFLDEPTNGLDPSGRKEMLSTIKSLAEEKGKTLILSTHILGDVEEVCKEVILLHLGKIKKKGTIEDLTGFAESIKEIIVIGPEEQIKVNLEKRGITIRSIKREGNMSRLKIGIPSNITVKDIFASVVECGGKIRSMTQVRRSLEEVFGEITEGR